MERTTRLSHSEELKERVDLVKIVSSNQIYNLPLFETYLVIDCRHKVDYDQEHIASALNYPPCESTSPEDILKALEEFATEASTSYINEIWTPIVLYGSDDDPTVTTHLTRFTERLIQYISTSNENMNNQPAEKKQRSVGLFSRISERTEEIWILQGGYEDFHKRYPMLCLPSHPDDVTGGMTMVPLPYHIALPTSGHGVLVGSRAVKWTSQLFRSFEIDCMLLDQETFETYAVPLTECVIETMITSLPDHASNQPSSASASASRWSTTQLHRFLDHSTQFIQECVQQSKRVLIQLHGRSHSSMVLLAWLMRYTFRLSFDDSYQELKKYLPRISSSLTSVLDENFLHQQELQHWQPGGQRLIENEQTAA
jgi:rhodanese-related sulfurtransferase